jgi:superoxide dismutase
MGDAYYWNTRMKRGKFIEAFWNIVNWERSLNTSEELHLKDKVQY